MRIYFVIENICVGTFIWVKSLRTKKKKQCYIKKKLKLFYKIILEKFLENFSQFLFRKNFSQIYLKKFLENFSVLWRIFSLKIGWEKFLKIIFLKISRENILEYVLENFNMRLFEKIEKIFPKLSQKVSGTIFLENFWIVFIENS